MPKRTLRKSQRRVGRSQGRRSQGRSQGRSQRRRSQRRRSQGRRSQRRSQRRTASGNQSNKIINKDLYIGKQKKVKNIKNFLIKNFNKPNEKAYQHQVINKNHEYGHWREGSPDWNKYN